MLSQYQRILFELAEHRRMNAMSDRVGSVAAVQKDKIRVTMGISHDGSPWLSPWLDTTDHRGGATERRQYVVGQNVRVSAPGGDYRQATVTRWAPSESYPAPAHADAITGESYQLGKLRVSKVGGQQSGGESGGSSGGGSQDHSYNIWVATEDSQNPSYQPQSGQKQTSVPSGGGGQQQQSNAGKPAMNLRISEKGGFTALIGSDDSGVPDIGDHDRRQGGLWQRQRGVCR